MKSIPITIQDLNRIASSSLRPAAIRVYSEFLAMIDYDLWGDNV
jgi:hypothetical protein